MRTGCRKRSTAGDKTICLPLPDGVEYKTWIEDSVGYRQYLNEQIAQHPELFPPEISQGYWQAFIDRMILADFHQEIGRLRAHRRPDESLEIVLLTDYALDIPTQQRQARDITLEAATSAEQTWQVITQVLGELWRQFERPPTQQEVAALAKVKQAQISKLAERFMGGWRQALKIFQTLLDSPYSQWNIFEPLPPEAEEEAHWLATQYLPALAQDATDEVLEQLGVVVEAYGWPVWQRVVSMLGVEVRARLAAAVAAALPTEVQRQVLRSVPLNVAVA